MKKGISTKEELNIMFAKLRKDLKGTQANESNLIPMQGILNKQKQEEVFPSFIPPDGTANCNDIYKQLTD